MKAFDQILDIWDLEYTEAVEKDTQNKELDCTDGVTMTFLQGFDLLKEEIEEFEKKTAYKT